MKARYTATIHIPYSNRNSGERHQPYDQKMPVRWQQCEVNIDNFSCYFLIVFKELASPG